jgi:GNAT superfamily N-acetyltransferase
MYKTVTTYYLEMTDSGQLRPKAAPRPDVWVQEAKVPLGDLHRFFYLTIGADYAWFDHANWSKEEWQAYAERDSVSLWVGFEKGTPFGYFELIEENNEVEVMCFGLLPAFIGKGLGGYLLTETIKAAWSKQPKRVGLHSCSVDHPSALANYQARGFTLYKEALTSKYFPDVE